jgi:hypothetical protein
MATALQTGTGDRITEAAATKELLNVKLFGKGYTARPDSVNYYRIEPPKGATS